MTNQRLQEMHSRSIWKLWQLCPVIGKEVHQWTGGTERRFVLRGLQVADLDVAVVLRHTDLPPALDVCVTHTLSMAGDPVTCGTLRSA